MRAGARARATQMRNTASEVKDMESVKLKIDEDRGTVSGYGEVLKLAKVIKPTDKGRWYVYADEIKNGREYDIVVINERGEVCIIWTGEYQPSSFAFRVRPVWAAGGKIFKSMRIAERMVKKRGVLGDDKR